MFIKDFDPYLVLGIPSTASGADVAKAYRKLSLKTHPDAPGGDAIKYQAITRAYHTITKESDRRNYEKFGNPEGVFEEKFGSMKGTTKAQQGAMMGVYLAAFAGVIGASYLYANRKRSVEEEESSLPRFLRAVRRSLRAMDLVAALPGAPTGLEGKEAVPTAVEDDLRGNVDLVAQRHKLKRQIRNKVWFGKWEKDRGEEAQEEQNPAMGAAAAASGGAEKALTADLSAHPEALGKLGAEEWRDFYEPRFEDARIALKGVCKNLPPLFDDKTPVDAAAVYESWSSAQKTLASASVDYVDAFRRGLVENLGEEEAKKLLDDKDRFGLLQEVFRMLEKKARADMDCARLELLLKHAKETDPRLSKKTI